MILLIKIFLAVWMWHYFEPIQKALFKINQYKVKKKYIKTIKEQIYKVVTCLYCTMFWVALAVTFSIYIAIGMCFVAWWIKKIELSL